ncbi:MAG: response regulator [Flavihumibacter sp.]
MDDEEDLCLLLKIYFTRKQFQVAVANTLQEGLLKLASWQPDILFLDNNLPDGLGWEQAEQLLRQYPALNIHLISAFHPDPPDTAQKNRLHIIEKPFTRQQLNALEL